MDHAQASITYDQWQHVAVSFAQSMPAPALYLDGVSQTLVIADPPGGTPPTVTSVPAHIGNRSAATDRDFAGRIDELRVADTIRSPAWVSVEVLASGDTLIEVGAERTR